MLTCEIPKAHNNDGEANSLQDEHHRSEREPAGLGPVGIENDKVDGGSNVDDGTRQTRDFKKPVINTIIKPSKTENAETNEDIVEITPEVQEMKIFYFLHGVNVIRLEEFNVDENGNKQDQMPDVANNKKIVP